MLKRKLLRQASRSICFKSPISKPIIPPHPSRSTRQLSTTAPKLKNDNDYKNDKYRASSTSAESNEKANHEGQFARTDESITVEYPDGEKGLAKSQIVQGRGGFQFKRTLDTFSLEGRVAVITGGARGLGLVMGQALVQSGADLAIVDLNEEEAARQAMELVQHFKETNPAPRSNEGGQSSGDFRVPKITAHRCDVADPDSVNDTISRVVEQHSKIDHLVTSAGFTENYDAISYPYDRIKKLWGVNVDGTYLFATGVAKHLMARNSPGSIVMIGSMSGSIVNVPQPQAPYNAAKAAVRHLAASLAVEWAHANIRVNCISPGYMLTALTRKILDDNPALAQRWTSLIPQGKMGQPEDLMGAVTFLLSDAAGYVTGADLRVDGGYTVT